MTDGHGGASGIFSPNTSVAYMETATNTVNIPPNGAELSVGLCRTPKGFPDARVTWPGCSYLQRSSNDCQSYSLRFIRDVKR